MIRRRRLRRELERELALLEVTHDAEVLRLRLQYAARKRDLERKLQDTYKRPR